MEGALRNANLLFVMVVITIMTGIFKCIAAWMYNNLLQELGKTGKTKNQWLKTMIQRYEAYYRLKRSVHNIENFVDRYLYEYRFCGQSFETWNCVGLYGGILIISMDLISSLLGLCYRFQAEWFVRSGVTTISLLLCIGVSEVILGNHRKQEMLRAQIIDYLENTIRSRLENTMLYQEKSDQNVLPEHRISPAMKELLENLLKETELDREIAKRQMLPEPKNENEQERIFEEVLQEYF